MQEVERLCDQVIVVAHGRTVAQGTVAALNAQCGERDFEESFVKLAFSAGERASQSPGRPKTGDVPLGGTARSAREQGSA
jgi:ABC-type multidrug transport system ATPase subunit